MLLVLLAVSAFVPDVVCGHHGYCRCVVAFAVVALFVLLLLVSVQRSWQLP